MRKRKRENKRCPLIRRTLCGDIPLVSFDNLPANREAYACSLVLALTVQASEGKEDSVKILFIKTDAIVCYTDATSLDFLLAVQLRRVNFNNWRYIRTMKL
jgi:hypothetical protein